MKRSIATNDANSPADTRFGRMNDERVFARAARHSRNVRLLRVAIPTAIVVIFSIIGAAAFWNPVQLLTKFPIDPSRLLIKGTKVTMEQPRVAGFTSDSRAYEFTASAAAQDLLKPDVLELKDLRAKVEMQDKAVLEMKAATGIYDTKTDIMRLKDDILLSSSAGYQGRLSEAVVDAKKGTVVSDSPVAVTMLNGTLNANRLEVGDNGAVVRFHGGVEMVLMFDPVPGSQAKAGP